VKEKMELLVAEMMDKRILLDEAVGELERKYIQTALSLTKGNQSKAAEVLGVHRNTLSRKISQYKLNGKR
jgi:Fis family transcriptional regulator, factor for inversion stimulation protein